MQNHGDGTTPNSKHLKRPTTTSALHNTPPQRTQGTRRRQPRRPQHAPKAPHQYRTPTTVGTPTQKNHSPTTAPSQP
eukprot:7636017-Prorocentrum_lima.AAC.1